MKNKFDFIVFCMTMINLLIRSFLNLYYALNLRVLLFLINLFVKSDFNQLFICEFD